MILFQLNTFGGVNQPVIDNAILLTKQGGILKPFALILGFIIDKVFFVLDSIGIPNFGLAIILFTIIVYLLMLPLTYKQQKFSKFSAKMNPELQAIQAKYKDRRDQESMMKMQSETQAVYEKYGVSPAGSCLQLLIQMPILFALYRVIYNLPAYITKVGNMFSLLSAKIISVDNGAFLKSDASKTMATAVKSYGKAFTKAFGALGDGAAPLATDAANYKTLSNGIVDVLNRLNTSDLKVVADHYKLSGIKYDSNDILSTFDASGKMIHKGLLDTYNTFLGLNISDSPAAILKSHPSIIIIIIAIMFPVLAAVTQWFNTILMPQPANNNNSQDNSMASSMQMMNKIMPIFSAFMCYVLPVGMGIYWIIGAVVRSIIQIFINKKIDKIDIDEMIKLNVEKANLKREKKGLPARQITNGASVNPRNSASYSSESSNSSNSNKKKRSQEEINAAIKDSTAYYDKLNGAKKGSLASKVMMVKQYNERNNSEKNSDSEDK